MSKTTLDTLQEFLHKTRRRLSDENPDYSDQDEENADPDAGMYSETEDPDETDKWIAAEEAKQAAAKQAAPAQKEAPQKPEYTEYEPGEDEDAHQEAAPQAAIPAPAKPEAPAGRSKNEDLQPTPDEIREMRQYTRPWEQRAREKAHLEAEPHKNPGSHAQGRIIEARNTSHADRNKAYEEFKNSPEFQKASPIAKMRLEQKFHKDWHTNNPDYMTNAFKAHSEAHKKGEEAKSLFNQAKDEKIRHIATGGAQPGAMSLEEGMQHAGGSREDEDSAPSGIQQDKGAAFASGNQEFIQNYMKNYDKKAKKFSPGQNAEEYDPGARKDVESILGEHPGLKMPEQKKKFDRFVEKYYPLIDRAAGHVLNKLGLADKEKRGEIDRGLLHEAGTHALFQAVNDYDHDHPSKAKFTTHLNRKMHGLMQTALKGIDEIPTELRAGAKKFDQGRRNENSSPVKHTDAQGNTTIINPATPKPAAPVAPKKSAAEIAAAHHPDIQDRLKRVVAAKGPIVRKQGSVQPKPAAPKWKINNVSGNEGGEE